VSCKEFVEARKIDLGRDAVAVFALRELADQPPDGIEFQPGDVDRLGVAAFAIGST
jgi:hypothetical protein